MRGGLGRCEREDCSNPCRWENSIAFSHAGQERSDRLGAQVRSVSWKLPSPYGSFHHPTEASVVPRKLPSSHGSFCRSTEASVVPRKLPSSHGSFRRPTEASVVPR